MVDCQQGRFPSRRYISQNRSLGTLVRRNEERLTGTGPFPLDNSLPERFPQ